MVTKLSGALESEVQIDPPLLLDLPDNGHSHGRALIGRAPLVGHAGRHIPVLNSQDHKPLSVGQTIALKIHLIDSHDFRNAGCNSQPVQCGVR